MGYVVTLLGSGVAYLAMMNYAGVLVAEAMSQAFAPLTGMR